MKAGQGQSQGFRQIELALDVVHRTAAAALPTHLVQLVFLEVRHTLKQYRLALPRVCGFVQEKNTTVFVAEQDVLTITTVYGPVMMQFMILQAAALPASPSPGTTRWTMPPGKGGDCRPRMK